MSRNPAVIDEISEMKDFLIGWPKQGFVERMSRNPAVITKSRG
jgi:hypothetical protein